jgi:hypothetical protein
MRTPPGLKTAPTAATNSSAASMSLSAAARISQRQKLATPSPSSHQNAAAVGGFRNQDQRRRLALAEASSLSSLNDAETVYSSLSGTPTTATNATLYSTVSNNNSARDTSRQELSRQLFSDKEASGGVSPSLMNSFTASSGGGAGGLDYHRAKATATELMRYNQGGGGGGGSYHYWQESREERRRSRDHLRQQLQQLALTSETGSASVIEVIEPDSSEEEQFIQSYSWGPRRRSSVQGDSSAAAAASAASSPHPAAVSSPPPPPRLTASVTSGQQRKFSDSAASSCSSSTSSYGVSSSSAAAERAKNGTTTSEPDILNGVRDVGPDSHSRRYSVDNLDSAAAAGGTTVNDSASSERLEEQLYAEGSEEQQQQQQQPSSYYYDERPDSVSSQKRRGFLKKLSLWGHQATNKTSKKQVASPTAGSSSAVGDGIITGGGKSETAAMDADYFRYNYMDRTRMSAGSGGRGEESPGGRRAASVTRIEVAAASASAAAEVNGDAGRSEAGGRTEVEQRQAVAGEKGDDRAQEQLQQQLEQQQQQQLGQQQPPLLIDPRLSKSLSPCSRKQQSAYSSYIRFVGFFKKLSHVIVNFKNMLFSQKCFFRQLYLSHRIILFRVSVKNS